MFFQHNKVSSWPFGPLACGLTMMPRHHQAMHMLATSLIKEMTPAIRRFIEWQHEQELGGGYRFSYQKPDPEIRPAARSRGSRWTQTANMACPAPFYRRPVSADGATSFHLKFSSIKKSQAAVAISGANAGRNPAASHDAYITAEHELQTPSSIHSAYIEAAGDPASRTVELLSNISPDPHMRERFWNAAWNYEKAGTADHLAVHTDRGSPTLWRYLASSSDVPDRLVKIAQGVCRQHSRKATLPAKARKPLRVDCEAGELDSLLDALKLIPDWDAENPPIRIALGRGGRVQHRVVFELPSELDREARGRIARSLADYVGARDLMFTAAVHEPDAHNDGRNQHVHFDFYDRPCRWIAEAKAWDLELSKPERKKHGVTIANKSPVFQAKAGERFEKAATDFVRELRSEFAGYCNRELVESGSARRLDPRTFAAMGIVQRPTAHLGNEASVLEAVGVPTQVGTENAYRIWTGAYDQVDVKAQLRDRHRLGHLAVLDQLHGEKTGVWDHWKLALLERHRKTYELAVGALDSAEADIERLEIQIAMARSRSEKTLQTCNSILRAVDGGTASVSDLKSEAAIRRRKRDAVAYLSAIDAQLSPWNSKLIAAKAEVLNYATLLTEMENCREAWLADLKRNPIAALSTGAVRQEASPAIATALRRPTPRISPHRRFQDILDRVKNDQLLIVSRERNGTSVLEPLGLTASEARLCRQAGFHTRATDYFSRAKLRQSFKVLNIKAQLELEGYQSVAEGSGQQASPELRNARLLFPEYREHPELAAAIDTAKRWDRANDASLVTAPIEAVVPAVAAPIMTDRLGTAEYPAAPPKLNSAPEAAAAVLQPTKTLRPVTVSGPVQEPDGVPVAGSVKLTTAVKTAEERGGSAGRALQPDIRARLIFGGSPPLAENVRHQLFSRCQILSQRSLDVLASKSNLGTLQRPVARSEAQRSAEDISSVLRVSLGRMVQDGGDENRGSQIGVLLHRDEQRSVFDVAAHHEVRNAGGIGRPASKPDEEQASGGRKGVTQVTSFATGPIVKPVAMTKHSHSAAAPAPNHKILSPRPEINVAVASRRVVSSLTATQRFAAPIARAFGRSLARPFNDLADWRAERVRMDLAIKESRQRDADEAAEAEVRRQRDDDKNRREAGIEASRQEWLLQELRCEEQEKRREEQKADRRDKEDMVRIAKPMLPSASLDLKSVKPAGTANISVEDLMPPPPAEPDWTVQQLADFQARKGRDR